MTETTVLATPPQQSGQAMRSSTEDISSPGRIAHTLTACCRCRQRKTRCDPSLPRCGPCERTNSVCEYFDQAKRVRIPRHYVVHLQHKVRELELQLEEMEKQEFEPVPEDMVRDGAAVRIQEYDESKFLGPSSGIAITRLVLQLAKQFTDSKSITDIVDQSTALAVKRTFEDEEVKPTSKVYPLISDVAADDLPQRSLANLLVRLFNGKVLGMYPFLHEPTLWQDVEDVYNNSPDAFQNFLVRMVLAVSLQGLDTTFAGLADSFYLSALKYLEDAVKPMNVKTIQCFIIIGCYSLLTPTRTAVYYVVGLAVRLAQALGLCEEKTIVQGANGRRANPLEIDMKRRIFWSIMVMEFGLAHSMGRASCFATSQTHIDVEWFEVVEDECITKDGIKPNAAFSRKKWIVMHFFKMRMLQLEIRRKLYQSKRPTPQDDSDPWFKEMEDKLISWRDASPDAKSGWDKAWFVGRYNTMVVFMFRPSPQVPRPKPSAAARCFPACKSNIYMHRDQIRHGNVDMTWIFTQAMFMTINTILWTLSYSEIRREHPREEVQEDLAVALDCIRIASERWPGVASALELYHTLIAACMQIYDKDGDVDIAAASPAETTGYESNRSRTTSPVVHTHPPPSRPSVPESMSFPADNASTFGRMDPSSFSSYLSNTTPDTNNVSAASLPNISKPSGSFQASFDGVSSASASANEIIFKSEPTAIHPQHILDPTFDASTQFPLPSTFPDLVSWNPSFNLATTAPSLNIPAMAPFEPPPPAGGADLNGIPEMFGRNSMPYADYLYPPSYDGDRAGAGLNHEQQMELLQTLESTGTGVIEPMINAMNAFYYPSDRRY